MSTNSKLTSFESKMQNTIQSLAQDLSTIRTGRAHVSMLDLIKVEVYGQKMPINQVATISTPESQLLTVQVWDTVSICMYVCIHMHVCKIINNYIII